MKPLHLAKHYTAKILKDGFLLLFNLPAVNKLLTTAPPLRIPNFSRNWRSHETSWPNSKLIHLVQFICWWNHTSRILCSYFYCEYQVVNDQWVKYFRIDSRFWLMAFKMFVGYDMMVEIIETNFLPGRHRLSLLISGPTSWRTTYLRWLVRPAVMNLGKPGVFLFWNSLRTKTSNFRTDLK